MTSTLESIRHNTSDAATAAFPENSSSSSSPSPADIRSTETSTADYSPRPASVIAYDTPTGHLSQSETVAMTPESSPDNRPETSVAMATPETSDTWVTWQVITDTSSGIQKLNNQSTEETQFATETRANEMSFEYIKNTTAETTDGATEYLITDSGISPENTDMFEEDIQSVSTDMSTHDYDSFTVTRIVESNVSPTHEDVSTASTYQPESNATTIAYDVTLNFADDDVITDGTGNNSQTTETTVSNAENLTSVDEGGVVIPQGNTRQAENSDLPSIQPSLMTSSEPSSTEMTSSTQNTEHFAPDNNSSKSPFSETFHFEITSSTETINSLSANISFSTEFLSTEQSTVENSPAIVKENSSDQSNTPWISDLPSINSILTTSWDPTTQEVTSSMLLSSQATQNSNESSTQASRTPFNETSVESSTQISLSSESEQTVTIDPSADMTSTNGVTSQEPNGVARGYSSGRTMTSVTDKTSEVTTEDLAFTTSWSAGRPLNEPSSGKLTGVFRPISPQIFTFCLIRA